MQFIPPPQQPPRPKRGLKVGKKMERINALFSSLDRAHKKASVYYALGEAAGISREKLAKHAGPAIALIEGAS